MKNDIWMLETDHGTKAETTMFRDLPDDEISNRKSYD
jgi:hypothetical protein